MEEPVSKSQKKREANYLQEIGVKLVELSQTKIDALPLTETLRKAIMDAKSIKSHGAKRRQAQLIGKLMRSADYEAIIGVYNSMLEEDSAVTAQFHDLERWRDRLIHEGKDALTEFLNLYHPDDLQHLRQLIKKAVEDLEKEKNTGASKALFRYLRSSIK